MGWTPRGPESRLQSSARPVSHLLIWAIAIGPTLEFTGRFGLTRGHVIGLIGTTFIGFVMAVVLYFMRRVMPAFWTVAGTTAVALVALYAFIVPATHYGQSSRILAEKMDTLLTPGEKIPMFVKIIGIGDPALFYTNRKARIVRDLSAYLDSDERRYCLMKRDDLELTDNFSFRVYVAASAGDKVIVSNFPQAPQSTDGFRGRRITRSR